MTELTFPTREEIITRYQRDHKLRNPDAQTGPGTQPYLDAVLLADQLMPIIAGATQAGRAIELEGKSLEELQALATRLRVTLTGETGSTGYVTIRSASGGTTILSGDECTDQNTGLRFRCSATLKYFDGGDVPIAAIDTGPATNLAAGTVLQWSAPRPGCSPTCTVAEQTDGSGLTGGASAEGREQIIEKIRDARTNPPASGNDAEYRSAIRETPGVQIEEAFVYPAIFGPGTVGWTFTVAPNASGSRIPSATAAGLVRAHLDGAMPATDMKHYLECTAEYADVALQVSWASTAHQWANETPWPSYYEVSPSSGSGAIQIGTVTSATEFQIVSANADYTTCGDPGVGTVFALWDAVARKFVRKVALTVTGTGPWTVTCDTSFDASDTTYTPVAGQRVMPWSSSLPDIAGPVVAYFETIGPGEITHDPLDGRRGNRVPESPKSWPSKTTKALDLSVLNLDSVLSGDVAEGSGVSATTHASSPRLLHLDELSVFPE